MSEKTAYPVTNTTDFALPAYDIKKWTTLMSNIYNAVNKHAVTFEEATIALTDNLSDRERSDFKDWMKYYTSNSHNAYKTAQLNSILKATLPQAPAVKPDLGGFQSFKNDSNKDAIDRKIKALISRFNSIEKIIADPELRQELQDRLDMSLKQYYEQLQALKRQIQLAPIRNVRSTILEDLIWRKAASLRNEGFEKTANFWEKFAQDAEQNYPPATIVTPLKTDPAAPLPAANIEQIESKEDVTDQAIRELMRKIKYNETGELENDNNSVVDIHDDPLAAIHITAQEIAQPQAKIPNQQPALEITEDLTKPQMPEGNLEITEEELPVKDLIEPISDDVFDQALASTTVATVIKRFEALANMFRTREIPRQLTMGDLELNHLNMSSFFPELAEAIKSSLESNQYCSSRIESILARLRGAVDTPAPNAIQLQDPELSAIKTNLMMQEDKEKQRKEKRKSDSEKQESDAESVITNVDETLNQPVKMPKTPEQTAPTEPITPRI